MSLTRELAEQLLFELEAESDGIGDKLDELHDQRTEIDQAEEELLKEREAVENQAKGVRMLFRSMEQADETAPSQKKKRVKKIRLSTKQKYLSRISRLLEDADEPVAKGAIQKYLAAEHDLPITDNYLGNLLNELREAGKAMSVRRGYWAAGQEEDEDGEEDDE